MSISHQEQSPGAASAQTGAEPGTESKPESKPESIAIVGAAGRFPRARNLAEFWQRLRAGEELVTFFSDEELLAAGVTPDLLRNPHYVRARAVLEDAELFDALFFGIPPREAEVLDPQQRVFLEVAWEALEDAGCDPDRYAGAIGVYAGLSMNSYLVNNLLPRPDVLREVGGYQLMLASDKDFLATRASYKLNLRGPGVTVQTACSTSLVAVQMACHSLLSYQCDMALAGGVSIGSPRAGGYLYQPGMILSPDGHCRPFDARGRGIVAGEGAGLVVLKRLSDALADGDTIRAVILGAAINNDGAGKVGFTAPSVRGQAEAILMAQAMAGVSPESIQYVEAHGTATELGDPIEIAALTQAFRLNTPARNFCAIGSVKSNMGHLDDAAGIAGLLKTVLALQHREIPPSLHFEQPNPNIDFAGSPFYVAAKLAPWPAGSAPRRAGVSSFGIGGTNAHVVVEEAPPVVSGPPRRRRNLLLLSTLTPSALDKATAGLAAHLQAHPELDLADVAYTLQVGRKVFGQRRFAVCDDREDAIRRLAGHAEQPLPTSGHATQRQPVAFLFPGQGAQYAGMGRDLYGTEEIFRNCIDECAMLLQPHLGLDLRELLFPLPGRETEAAATLRQTAYTQPALFAVEIALARQWMAWGIEPAAMIGHSIGEYVAACLAGVFSLADGLALVAARGRLMQSLPEGSMLAVPLAEAGVVPYLGPELSVAAVNAPQMCVVSGTSPAVEALAERLAADGVQCQRLHTSHAFHSPMMEPILDEFAGRVAAVPLQAPSLPYLSNVTGNWITPQQATDPRYWAQHLRLPVLFAPGVRELLVRFNPLLLEVGPGHSLAALVKQQGASGPGNTNAAPVLPSLRHPHDRTPDDLFLLNTLGKLWLAGADIDWLAFHAGEQRLRVPLPTYPFERTRFWVEPPVGGVDQPARQLAEARTPAAVQGSGLSKRQDAASWFYAPSWRQMDLPPVMTAGGEPAQPPQHWLLFADRTGLAAGLAARLEQQGCTVTVVTPGSHAAPVEAGARCLEPGDAAGHSRLFEELRSAGRLPQRIVHLWNAGGDCGATLSPAAIRQTEETAFYSLLHLSQAIAQWGGGAPIQLDVVTSGVYDVTGDEVLSPAKALALGPCLVLPQEQPEITCRLIDLALPDAGTSSSARAGAETLLWRELQSAVHAPVVALRGRHRWVQSYASRPLPAPGSTPALLRQDGVYLITGGLGGVGLALAERLAQRVRARLVLTARSPLPERFAWEHWLAEHGEEDPTSRKIRAVQRLEAQGSLVLALPADVTDPEQMRGAVRAAVAAFGAINGVIHAAGVPGGGIIPLKTRAAADGVLAPKVAGTANLHTALQGLAPDFVLLCSSYNAIGGAAGQVDYSAANAFLDAYAHARMREAALAEEDRAGGAGVTISVNWPAWQETGMAFATEVPEQLRHFKEQNLRLGLRTSEGQDAFERILAEPLPQWIVSPVALPDLLAVASPTTRRSGLAGTAQDAAHAVSQPGERVAQPSAPQRGASHARPALLTPYVAPRNELEGQIADVWQVLFGIDQIGVHDNFFELGGHSLMATQVLVRLREQLGVDLPVRTIFESLTIAELASQLEIILWAAQSQQDGAGATDEDREELEF